MNKFLYVVFPEFFGLRHYVVYGGVRPEPVDGAAMLGCPRWAASGLIVTVSALVIGGLAAYLWQHQEPESATDRLKCAARAR